MYAGNKNPLSLGRGVFIPVIISLGAQTRANGTKGELLAPLWKPHRLSVPAASHGVLVKIISSENS